MPEPVAGERCVLEFCRGAGSVPGFGEQGPGGGNGRLRPWRNACRRHYLRVGISAGAIAAHKNVREPYDAVCTVRGTDDCAYRGFTIHSERKNGGAARPDGIDSGDGGRQSIASGVQPAAPDFG